MAKAMGLFWQRGYYGTSMKQIEQALDMRPGSLYAAFGSKDGLFAEALKLYAQRGGEELAAHLEGYNSILTGLQEYLRNLATAFSPSSETPARACMIVKTLLEVSHEQNPLGRQANAMLSEIELALADLLARARARGELKAGTDCNRLARLVQAQIIGLRSYAQRDTSSEHVNELGDDMASMLEHYRAAS
ncbi:MAG: helix-turn-helix domain-containing protein [Marinobacter sp.]|uniref:TetR/AcrR family transcriptional regulator n=1 Tax=Marinobacter sp. TaxID=50741 RepID=UPI00299E92E7|nr:helix-turn-helix domain-containing protein [Marinobacter sp.]MDX1635533.1 helix-turn-helix domain-containing protein [Marinobacter sp.]